MRRIPPIRSALLGISGATAAMLIGFTPSGATAATHATAQQAHPIVTTHTTGAQSTTGKAAHLLPCGTVEGERGNQYGHAVAAPLNIRNGPSYSCRVIGKAYSYERLRYYCTSDGWTYLRNMSRGTTGWAVNDYLSRNGSNEFCGFGLAHQ
jgi:hypothetical protein